MPEQESVSLKARIVDQQEFAAEDIADLRSELSREGGRQQLREIAGEIDQRILQSDQAGADRLLVRLGVVEYLLGERRL